MIDTQIQLIEYNTEEKHSISLGLFLGTRTEV